MGIRQHKHAADCFHALLHLQQIALLWRAAKAIIKVMARGPLCSNHHEEGRTMFEQVIDNVRRATEFNIRMQQKLFKKCGGFFPGFPVPAEGGPEVVTEFNAKVAAFVADVVKKQRGTLVPRFDAGLKIVEEACHLMEVKDTEEMRTKTIDVWQKTCDCMRQLYEAEMADVEAIISQWTELVTKGIVPQETEAAAA
jgi:hypothetical protein